MAPTLEKDKDPDAPYGRFSNGKPRKSPPRQKSSGAGPKAASTKRAAPRQPDYRPGIKGLAQLLCVPLSFAAPADAFTVQTYIEGSAEQPGIADALNDLAKDRPEVAAALQRVLHVGPYGALLGAVLPMVVQLAHNHDLIPEGMAVRMGATPRDQILAHLRAEAAQYAQEERRQAEAEQPGPDAGQWAQADQAAPQPAYAGM